MHQSRIQAVDHVVREAPIGLGEALRWFYGCVGCLDEIPPHSTSRPVVLFRSARIELRVYLVDNPQVDSAGFPVVLAVESLEETAELLDERSVQYERITATHWGDVRLETSDPGGNRVDFVRHTPVGPL